MSLQDFSIERIQDNLRDTLRTYLYPQCLVGGVNNALSDAANRIDLAQEIKLYSTEGNIRGDARGANTMQVDFRIRRDGTPDAGILVNIVTDDNGSPSTSTIGTGYSIPVTDVTGTYSTISCTLAFDWYLGSNTKYWLKLESTNSLSATDYFLMDRTSSTLDYWLGQGYVSVNQGIWNTISGDLYFKCSIPNYIYTDYPREDLDRNSYPRVATVITERDEVERPYISKTPVIYQLACDTLVYSRYPGECNDIISLVDRIFFDRSTSLDPYLNLRLSTPSRLFPMTMVRDYYVRSVRTIFTWRMTQ